ncbi:MAG: hypothetical protein ABWW66_01385 [Archaeoglobaceae archaeon]
MGVVAIVDRHRIRSFSFFEVVDLGERSARLHAKVSKDDRYVIEISITDSSVARDVDVDFINDFKRFFRSVSQLMSKAGIFRYRLLAAPSGKRSLLPSQTFSVHVHKGSCAVVVKDIPFTPSCWMSVARAKLKLGRRKAKRVLQNLLKCEDVYIDALGKRWHDFTYLKELGALRVLMV